MDANERRRLTRRAKRGDVGAALMLAAAGKPAIADDLLRRLAAAGAEGMWRVLGNMHANLGNQAEAIAALRHAIEVEPQWFNAYVDLAIVLINRREFEEAETLCRTAIAGGHTPANYTLGRILVELGKLDEAEASYLVAAEAGDVDAMFNLGNLCDQVGRLDDAERWFAKAAAAGDDEAQRRINVAGEPSSG